MKKAVYSKCVRSFSFFGGFANTVKKRVDGSGKNLVLYIYKRELKLYPHRKDNCSKCDCLFSLWLFPHRLSPDSLKLRARFPSRECSFIT